MFKCLSPRYDQNLFKSLHIKTFKTRSWPLLQDNPGKPVPEHWEQSPVLDLMWHPGGTTAHPPPTGMPSLSSILHAGMPVYNIMRIALWRSADKQRSVKNMQRRTMAHHTTAPLCVVSHFAVVHWLIVCPPFGSDSVWSTSLCQFQIILRIVGRLGSEVRVSVSFQSCTLRMFVCPIMFFAVLSAVPCAGKVIFYPACPVMFRETP